MKKMNQCLSKTLLDSVSDNVSGLDLYKRYFESFALADADANLSCLKSRPKQVDKVVNSMYKSKHPSHEPTFFSVDSFHDLCRLSTLMQTEIVIYWSVDETRRAAFNIFHDFRLLSATPKEVKIFLITTDKRVQHYSQPENDIRVEVNYMSSKTALFECDWATTISKLIDLPLDTPALLQKVPDDLQENREALYNVWQKPVLFVALCKTKMSTVSNKWLRQTPSNSHFVTVALVGPPIGQMSLNDLQGIEHVVCFVGGQSPVKQICLLKDSFRKHVLANLIRTTHKDKLYNRDYLQLPKVTKDAQAKAADERKAKKKKFVSRAELKGRKCVCEICSDPSYTANMSKVGPEKLITYSPDVTELLRFLGLDSDANIKAVEKLCELSVASMDIESTTVPLDLAKPVDPSTGVRHSVIDKIILEGHLQKIQKPLMIAHLDSLMPNEDPKVFVVQSDSEEAIYAMMREYWAFVRARQQHCKAVKEELVEPILAVINEYRLKHTQFHMDWWRDRTQDAGEDEKPDIAGTWRNSIPGKLSTALSKLISNYAIFSFYG